MQPERVEQRGGTPPARAAQASPRADAQRVHAPRRRRDEDADGKPRDGWRFFFPGIRSPRAARQTRRLSTARRGTFVSALSFDVARAELLAACLAAVVRTEFVRVVSPFALLAPAFRERLGDDALELAALGGERRRLRLFRLELFRRAAKAPLELSGALGGDRRARGSARRGRRKSRARGRRARPAGGPRRLLARFQRRELGPRRVADRRVRLMKLM